MNNDKIKRLGSVLFVLVGAAALISEISSANKNYYIQIVGVLLLMLGLFLINSKVKSKTAHDTDQYFEEE